MKNNNKGEIMDNLKKVGLTALAGSLAAISANAAEMSVSGATVLTYTSEDPTEVTGNPYGMKTNLSFTASGEVNGYTVSYMQTSMDKFAGMSSARMTIDMGDMGTLAFDQGSGSGLSTIDDKTPTAAEEIWDGLDGTTVGGLVGASSSGAWNYIKSFNGVTFNGSYVKGSATKNSDGASSANGNNGSSWDFALTSSDVGVDGLSVGAGYGDIANDNDEPGSNKSEHSTIFANYSVGMVTFGAQFSEIDNGANAGTDEETQAWGISANINDNLSVSYGQRDVDFIKQAANDVTETGKGVAVAYTMGSIKVAGNMNEVEHNNGTSQSNDEMMEIAVSFAF
jgi:outer membrane protein OmpU